MVALRPGLPHPGRHRHRARLRRLSSEVGNEQAEGQRGSRPRRPRHGDGRADAAILAAGGDVVGTEARRRADAADAARRAADRVSRQRAAGSASWTTAARIAAPRLFLGRNEENGIRCVYHGWKFDVDGNCVDMPNAPATPGLQGKGQGQGLQGRRAQRPRLGLYGRARQQAPPLPGIEASLLPESEVQITFAQRECNWLQALEGDIDTSHFGFLHAGSVDPANVPDDNLIRCTVANRAPEYHVDRHRLGHDVCRLPPAEAGQDLLALCQFPVAVLDPDAAGQV